MKIVVNHKDLDGFVYLSQIIIGISIPSMFLWITKCLMITLIKMDLNSQVDETPCRVRLDDGAGSDSKIPFYALLTVISSSTFGTITECVIFVDEDNKKSGKAKMVTRVSPC